jgi:hypothetical protein
MKSSKGKLDSLSSYMEISRVYVEWSMWNFRRKFEIDGVERVFFVKIYLIYVWMLKKRFLSVVELGKHMLAGQNVLNF